MDLSNPPFASLNRLWDVLPESCAIKRWAADLRAAVNDPADAGVWADIGQGVLFQHDDVPEAESLIPAIAAYTGLRLVMVDVDGAKPDLAELGREPGVMICLRAGEWLGGNIDEDGDVFGRPRHPDFERRAAIDFRRSLQKALEGEWKGKAVIVVVAVEHATQMEYFLRVPGVFDRKVVFPPLAPELVGELFMAEMGAHRFEDEVRANPKRLGLTLKSNTSTIIHRGRVAKYLARRARQSGRRLSFGDIYEVVIFGDSERHEHLPVTDEQFWSTAVHEAGHALVAYLDSVDGALPAYCTILPSRDSLGFMANANDAYSQTRLDLRVRDVRHEIRVCLARRAAEVLMLGADNVSASGAVSDLNRASGLATMLVSFCGIPLFEGDGAGSNLLIEMGGSDAESYRTSNQARAFLAQEFAVVTAMLEQHSDTLRAYAEALMDKKVLLEEDSRPILASDEAPIVVEKRVCA